MSKKIRVAEIILREPFRTAAARKLNQGHGYAGPTFTDCKTKHNPGALQVCAIDKETGKDVLYSYPWDTIARVKEYDVEVSDEG